VWKESCVEAKDVGVDQVSSSVIAANIEMYREVAESYDGCWNSVFGLDLNPALERDLETIACSFSVQDSQLRCLDCGAGTGAITLRMLAHGWRVTAVDVSPEMLGLLEKKLASHGSDAILVNRSIEEFLGQDGSQYHLIGFNSVLHHVYNYSKVLSLAVDRLLPGGFLYTNVDPVISFHPAISQIFDSFDTAIAKLLYERSDFIPGTRRRLRKLLRKPDPIHRRKVSHAGDIAEFHARCGVNDSEILQLLRACGLSIIKHSRYPLARTPVTNCINRLFKLRQEFKIIARKPSASCEDNYQIS
jgi:ubiquinone/menaquinone biosynthesis C-methylase UbiE